MDRLNQSGALYLTHTRLDDRIVLRLAVGAPATRREHIEAAWNRIVEVARRAHRRGSARRFEPMRYSCCNAPTGIAVSGWESSNAARHANRARTGASAAS